MAIAKDASTPANVDSTGNSSATNSTASFTPPAGSLVVLVVDISFSSSSSTGPTVTVSDGTNSLTAGPAVYDTRFDYTGIFLRYYASAPGSITLTATRSMTNAGLFQLVPFVLTGCASSQAGAASNTNSSAVNSTSPQVTLTPTTTGSWVIACATGATTEASFTPVNISTDHSLSDSGDACYGACGHAASPALASTAFGFTVPSSTVFSCSGLEILPFTGSTSGPNSPGTGTDLGGGTGSWTNPGNVTADDGSAATWAVV